LRFCVEAVAWNNFYCSLSTGTQYGEFCERIILLIFCYGWWVYVMGWKR